MRKLLVFAVLMIAGLHKSYSQNLLDLIVQKIDGDSIALKTFGGKQLLFILVPVDADSGFYSLQQFAGQRSDSIQIFGIPSLEDGYTDNKKQAVISLYSGLNIILLEPMHTRKSSPSQSILMKWLTDKDLNHHFNQDVSGIGQKFFVDRTARLYAVLPGKLSLQSPIIERVLNTNPPPFLR